MNRPSDPFILFREWLTEAEASEPNDPTAMTVATADADGAPSARMCLMRGFDERGFAFYTNFESRKGHELLANPRAFLLFHWKSLRRQVRIEGPVERVTDAEADEYFASRPRDSQIGAWASQQSRPLEGRFELEKRVAEYALKFGISRVPRPPHWSGFRVLPKSFEFWQDRPFRLHDRTTYQREGDKWVIGHLYP